MVPNNMKVWKRDKNEKKPHVIMLLSLLTVLFKNKSVNFLYELTNGKNADTWKK